MHGIDQLQLYRQYRHNAPVHLQQVLLRLLFTNSSDKAVHVRLVIRLDDSTEDPPTHFYMSAMLIMPTFLKTA